MLITFWAGICGVTQFASSDVTNGTLSLINQDQVLFLNSSPHSEYFFNDIGSENEYKTLFSEFVMSFREIEGPVAYQSFNSSIKIEEGTRPVLSLPENHCCRSLHNISFFCKYQT